MGRRPYPIWEDLRQRCPVAHTDRYGGAWFPATHAGVSQIAKDTDNFTSRAVVMGNGRPTELDLPAPIGGAPPITSDPPFHAIARRLILPAFAPAPINALEPMIRDLCSKLLDGMAGEDVVNAGTKYAQYIPPSVIRGMLGFPEEDIEQFFEFVQHHPRRHRSSRGRTHHRVRTGREVLRGPDRRPHGQPTRRPDVVSVERRTRRPEPGPRTRLRDDAPDPRRRYRHHVVGHRLDDLAPGAAIPRTSRVS